MGIESQWVTFRLGEEMFGMEIQSVKEMLRLPKVHVMPAAAADNLGVILLRAQVIPVFDLRRKFGKPARAEFVSDLIALLQAREQDHINWLSALDRAITERGEFALALDPHKCKFGLWYDSYEPEDPLFARILKRFDKPHQRIHEVGVQVMDLMSRGLHDQARTRVETARSSVLNQLIMLFAEAVNYLQDSARSSLIVVGSSACTLGIAVDEIDAVVHCNDDDIQAPDSIPGIEQFGGLIGLLQQKNSDRFIMLLDPAQLYPQLILRSSGSFSM